MMDARQLVGSDRSRGVGAWESQRRGLSPNERCGPRPIGGQDSPRVRLTEDFHVGHTPARLIDPISMTADGLGQGMDGAVTTC
jgi:hypothetical protein